MTEHPTMMTQDTIQMSQNRFHMAGHSLKKCDSYDVSVVRKALLTSTSLTVEDHCML